MFGKTLKMLRNNLNLTQQDLATKLQVGTSTIGMYESGKRMPDAEILSKLANIFNVSVDYLLGRTNDKNADRILEAANDDNDLKEFTQQILERESLQLLFKQTKNMDDKDINKVLKIIKAIEDEEDRQEGL